MNVSITKTTAPGQKTSPDKLGFGKLFSDHMFLMDIVGGQKRDPRIVPFGPLTLSPAATVLHYGQEIFEGLKAYRAADGRILLFRVEDNARRMEEGAQRLCLYSPGVEDFVEAVKTLVNLERDWVPAPKGTSLYIRPNLFGIDTKLGVDSAEHVLFNIICSPSGAYYSTGLAPVKIYVEDNYVRAVRGGLGYTKTGGNYAASLKAGVEAHQTGYNQVLWLDGVERKYVEEVGAMNMFFLFKDELCTPELQGSILPGVTRRSIIQLARDFGMPVTERRIAMEEIYEKSQRGQLVEAFGSGTAAVVSPVSQLKWGERLIDIGDGSIGPVTQRFYDTLTAIQYGEAEDTHGWTTEVR